MADEKPPFQSKGLRDQISKLLFYLEMCLLERDTSPDKIKPMKKSCTILLLGLITVFSTDNSIASVSVDEAIKKRIEMFKSSGKNIKKLNKLIRSNDNSKAVQLLDFHVTWSEKMSRLFPLGSEESTSNGSEASSDIWRNSIGFKHAIKQYNLASNELQKSLRNADSASINDAIKSFVATCKGCHKQYRN